MRSERRSLAPRSATADSVRSKCRAMAAKEDYAKLKVAQLKVSPSHRCSCRPAPLTKRCTCAPSRSAGPVEGARAASIGSQSRLDRSTRGKRRSGGGRDLGTNHRPGTSTRRRLGHACNPGADSQYGGSELRVSIVYAGSETSSAGRRGRRASQADANRRGCRERRTARSSSRLRHPAKGIRRAG